MKALLLAIYGLVCFALGVVLFWPGVPWASNRVEWSQSLEREDRNCVVWWRRDTERMQQGYTSFYGRTILCLPNGYPARPN